MAPECEFHSSEKTDAAFVSIIMQITAMPKLPITVKKKMPPGQQFRPEMEFVKIKEKDKFNTSKIEKILKAAGINPEDLKLFWEIFQYGPAGTEFEAQRRKKPKVVTGKIGKRRTKPVTIRQKIIS